MMNNKAKLTFFLGFGLVALICLLVFFISIGIGFGNAAVKTIENIDTIKKDWKDEGINPLDSIFKEFEKFVKESTIDSTLISPDDESSDGHR